jgi:hypothetical protein
MGFGPDFTVIRRAASLGSGFADGAFHAVDVLRDGYKISWI